MLSAIRHLPALFAIIGLLVGPLAKPAMAMPVGMHPPVASEQVISDDAAAMEEMPCCPKKTPVPDCDHDCLFMAMCTAQFLSTAVQGVGLVLPLGRAGVLLPGDDTKLAGLSQRPPPKPPKT